jgi:hypothetical protein
VIYVEVKPEVEEASDPELDAGTLVTRAVAHKPNFLSRCVLQAFIAACRNRQNLGSPSSKDLSRVNVTLLGLF